MPKKPKELTVLEVKHLGLGTHNLGGVKGLYLRKTPSQEMFFLHRPPCFLIRDSVNNDLGTSP